MKLSNLIMHSYMCIYKLTLLFSGQARSLTKADSEIHVLSLIFFFFFFLASFEPYNFDVWVKIQHARGEWSSRGAGLEINPSSKADWKTRSRSRKKTMRALKRVTYHWVSNTWRSFFEWLGSQLHSSLFEVPSQTPSISGHKCHSSWEGHS